METFFCSQCSRKYESESGLRKHNKKCRVGTIETVTLARIEGSPPASLNRITTVLNSNSDLETQSMDVCMEQYAQQLKTTELVSQECFSRELRYLIRQASHGDPVKQYELALYYKMNASENEQDLSSALRYFRLSAEQGYAPAQCALALCFYEGVGLEKNINNAICLYQKAAAQNYAEAQYKLGIHFLNLFSNINGHANDAMVGIDLISLAAEQGHDSAQYTFATIHESLTGIVPRMSSAISWYMKSALQGNALAELSLGRIYFEGSGIKQNYPEAITWFRMAAAQGLAVAQFYLGLSYKHGLGIPTDQEKACQWFHRSAAQGHGAAQNILGKCYEEGVGVTLNTETAISLYKASSAKTDFPPALFNLAVGYDCGIGVSIDKAMAVKYYTVAAKLGHVLSQFNLGVCYRFGDGIPINKSLAIEWFEKAAQRDFAPAQYFLGEMYYDGEGVEPNYVTALELFQQAVIQNYEPAKRIVLIIFNKRRQATRRRARK